VDRLVSSEWLEKELGAADLRILDCTVKFGVGEDGLQIDSGRAAWEAAHIPGSRHVDLLGALADASAPVPMMCPPAEQFAGAMESAGVGDGCRVVLYDGQMNAWAARVWWMLWAFGFERAAVLDGGWRAWSGEDRPVATGPESPPPESRFTARPRGGLLATKEEVLGALEDEAVAIVNALDPAAYRGERVDYGRAGHIPGSLNVPFMDLVDRHTHRYLSPERLREAFSDVLATNPERILTYCGAGVAASSAAFALGLFGVDRVAVYDGSMFEWAADPSLPLVTGDD
jgi:thiosulfate/3-mercaptopyruvate sulfurtransferase